MGISARGSFDLDQHIIHSGKALDYSSIDSEGGKNQSIKFVPHTIEPSIGLDRYADRQLIVHSFQINTRCVGILLSGGCCRWREKNLSCSSTVNSTCQGYDYASRQE